MRPHLPSALVVRPPLQQRHDFFWHVYQCVSWHTERPEHLKFGDFLLEMRDGRCGWRGFKLLEPGDRFVGPHHQELIERRADRFRQSRRYEIGRASWRERV